jgi:hypothetical protein
MPEKSTAAYIQTVLLTAPEGGLTPREIAERAELPLRAVRIALAELCDANITTCECNWYYAITSRVNVFWQHHVRRLVEHVRTAANCGTKAVMRALCLPACLLHALCERGNIEVVDTKRIRILHLRTDVQAARKPHLNARQCAALNKSAEKAPKMMVRHFASITGFAPDDAKIVLQELEARGIVESIVINEHTSMYMLAYGQSFKIHPNPAAHTQTTAPRRTKAAPACRNARRPAPTIRPAQPVTEPAAPTPAELPVTTTVPAAPTMVSALSRTVRATLTWHTANVSPRNAQHVTSRTRHSTPSGVTGPPQVKERRAAPDAHLNRVTAGGEKRAPPAGYAHRPPDLRTNPTAVQPPRSTGAHMTQTVALNPHPQAPQAAQEDQPRPSLFAEPAAPETRPQGQPRIPLDTTIRRSTEHVYLHLDHRRLTLFRTFRSNDMPTARFNEIIIEHPDIWRQVIVEIAKHCSRDRLILVHHNDPGLTQQLRVYRQDQELVNFIERERRSMIRSVNGGQETLLWQDVLTLLDQGKMPRLPVAVDAHIYSASVSDGVKTYYGFVIHTANDLAIKGGFVNIKGPQDDLISAEMLALLDATKVLPSGTRSVVYPSQDTVKFVYDSLAKPLAERDMHARSPVMRQLIEQCNRRGLAVQTGEKPNAVFMKHARAVAAQVYAGRAVI